ncbi:uncharacterized protein LOC129774126 [Toxorhynchites rutilus septentrionalis]|uniref:uncharacterized protein LOC129774126 n=1 Tax=Toxorhynchites rutilus septentrionalis TaxID=329112 RepID=UPI00247B25A5|nr:uncharacterized protein LOC129774126 [Toxorhynchites rutilus septentrionalis]
MSPTRMLTTIVLALAVLLLAIEASPMYYKKVAGQKFEPDWVAVSSTVIPLAEYRVSVGALKSTPPDEYKRAYLRHKKLTALSKVKLDKEGTSRVVVRVQQHPDTLITAGKKIPEKKSTGD